jgi:NAD(P)-dependent dehydrogenase (short-subunit alcohol dehydrogenase family)
VVAQRNPEASLRSAEGSLPPGVLLLSVDIKKLSEVDELVKATIAHFGRIDIPVKAPHKIRVNCAAPGDVDTRRSAQITQAKAEIGESRMRRNS